MPGRIAKAHRLHALLILIVCAAVYLPMLGSSGFASSEGHRVIPGWTMAQTGHWDRMVMFGRPFLTKPPGLPWLIGADSLLLGRTEFSARLISAVCAAAAALLAMAFANRWFGRPWGLAAGLTQALMPWMWAPARSAEIEALNQLTTMAAAFCLLTLLLEWRSPRRGTALLAVGGAAGLAAMLLAKGPAGAPCLLGVIVAGSLAHRSLRPLSRLPVLVMFLAGLLAAALAAEPFLRAMNEPRAVTEPLTKYLFNEDRLTDALRLVPAFLIASLPASLALPFVPWSGRLVERAPDRAAAVTARALGLAFVLSVGTYVLMLMGNHRHAMPAAVFLPPLVASALSRIRRPAPADAAAWRVRLGRVLMLGDPAVWPIGLIIGAAVWIPLSEASRSRNSGRDAGRTIAAALPTGATVEASSIIFAVPETLLYAERAAAADGRSVTVKWMPDAIGAGRVPATGSFLVLRHGDAIDEREAYERAITSGRLAPVIAGTVHHSAFTLYRVAAGADGRAP